MSADKEEICEVGYRRPPRHTRFRKGQSGNPRGRPEEAKNLTSVLNDALNEPVTVADNGRRRKISKRQVIIMQLVNQSAKADWRAIKILLDILRDIEARSEPASLETASFSATDAKVIEQLIAQFSEGKRDDR